MSEALIESFRYNLWANERIFDSCETLSDAQLDATLDGTFGTVRDTLVHIAAAQARIAAALGESEFGSLPQERDPFPGIPALREHARVSGEMLVALASSAQDGATVTIDDHGRIHAMPKWLLFIQAIEHAIEHRTQITAVLTHLGVEPPGVDGWTYHEDVYGGNWSELWSWSPLGET